MPSQLRRVFAQGGADRQHAAGIRRIQSRREVEDALEIEGLHPHGCVLRQGLREPDRTFAVWRNDLVWGWHLLILAFEIVVRTLHLERDSIDVGMIGRGIGGVMAR